MPSPIEIAIVSSGEDAAERERLGQHLEALAADHPLVVRGESSASIREQVGGADVVLVLVSPALVGSAPLDDDVRRALLERHAGSEHVVPIVLRPTPEWTRHPELRRLAALPDFATAVSDWVDADSAWAKIERGLRRVLEHVVSRRGR